MSAPRPAVKPPARLPWPPLLMAATVAAGLALDKISGAMMGDLLANLPLRAMGGALIAAALVLDIWCARTLAQQETTILPHRVATSLVTGGGVSFLAQSDLYRPCDAGAGARPDPRRALHRGADSVAGVWPAKIINRAGGATSERTIRRRFSRLCGANAAMALT